MYKWYEVTIATLYYFVLTAIKNFDLKLNSQNTTIILVCCRFCLERKTEISMTRVPCQFEEGGGLGSVDDGRATLAMNTLKKRLVCY